MLYRDSDGQWRVDAEAAHDRYGTRAEGLMLAAALAMIEQGHSNRVVDSLLSEGPAYASSLPRPDQLTLLLAILDRFATDHPQHANLIEVIRRHLPRQVYRKTTPRVPPAIMRNLEKDIRAGVGIAKLYRAYGGHCSRTMIAKVQRDIRSGKR